MSPDRTKHRNKDTSPAGRTNGYGTHKSSSRPNQVSLNVKMKAPSPRKHKNENPIDVSELIGPVIHKDTKRRVKVSRWLRRVNMKHAQRPNLDPKLERKLRIEFSSEIDALSAIIGRNLEHWKHREL